MLYLDRKGPPAARQVGHDPLAGFMHLLQQDAPFVLGPGDHRIGFGQGVVANALHRFSRFLRGVGHHDLGLRHPLGRVALALGLNLVGLALGLAQQG